MRSPERKALLQSIATTIADYRSGEIPSPTPEHVEKWLSQFDDDEQQTILEETNLVLSKSYLKKERAHDLLVARLSNPEIVGPDPVTTLARVRFLDIQRKGNSQKDLLSLAGEVLQSRYGLTVDGCGAAPTSYIYADDCLFSGSTVFYDLEKWLPNATPDSRLHVIFFARYSRGLNYTRKKLARAAAAYRVSVSYWSSYRFLNEPWVTKNFDCLWPSEFSGDHFVDEYVRSLSDQSKDSRYPPRIFRPRGTPAEERMFSSPAARAVVERAFLRAGTRIASYSRQAKVEMRPLGYDKLASLGFGALFVTYRNIANNCPLAFWWGDPDASPTETLGKWYPLFPRKANAPGNFDFEVEVEGFD
jgi:hypothetical protein